MCVASADVETAKWMAGEEAEGAEQVARG